MTTTVKIENLGPYKVNVYRNKILQDNLDVNESVRVTLWHEINGLSVEVIEDHEDFLNKTQPQNTTSGVLI